MECSVISPALSLLMQQLVIGQRQIAPNFSSFHWLSGFHWSAFCNHEGSTFTKKNNKPETSLITESGRSKPNH